MVAAVPKELTGIKELYEAELNNARKLRDDLAKEKAKLYSSKSNQINQINFISGNVAHKSYKLIEKKQ